MISENINLTRAKLNIPAINHGIRIEGKREPSINFQFFSLPRAKGMIKLAVAQLWIIAANENTHPVLALPIYKKSILVNFEHAIQLDLGVILFFWPAVEDASCAKWFRYLDLPIELEPLRHLRQLCSLRDILNQTPIRWLVHLSLQLKTWAIQFAMTNYIA